MVIQQSYVIIGNGIAGITAAELLRAADASGAITIVADDPFPSYYRPALKDYLGGHFAEEKLWARPTTFYQEQRIRFIPGRVVGIGTMQRFVQLHNGKYINYTKLLLANGARPRTLSCPGLDLAGVSTLRTVADYQEVRRRLERASRVVICGSGTLALESAETLHHLGYQVTHLVRGDRLWSEVLDPVASDIVLQEERRAGIDVRTQEEIAEIVGKDGQVTQVLTNRGERIPCDMVLIAVGIEPVTDFIRVSGIACGRGVQVDQGMRTTIPDIYAAGDVVETVDALTGHARVIGQWFPAIQQARIAAYNMLGLLPTTQDVPAIAPLNYYNATFLVGLNFVSVGLTTRPPSSDYEEILAAPQPRSYRKAIIKRGILVGALLLGERQQGLAFKRAIDHRVNILPVARRLFAADFQLATWLDEQGVPPPLFNVHDTDPVGGSASARSEAVFLIGEEDPQDSLFGDVDAYFVPIPHPAVRVAVTETRLNAGGQEAMLTIGRQTGSSLLLEHCSVSRLHAELRYADGKYLLRDVGSSNGTFVNGVPLGRGSVYRLRRHDQVRFGDVQFRFELRPRQSGPVVATPISPASFLHTRDSELHASVSRLIPPSVLRTLTDAPTLVLLEQGSQAIPRVLTLDAGRRYTLGRDERNDIVLNDASASRQHAELFAAPDGFYVRDLQSRYGVFVNKMKITNAYHLSHGDRLVLGNTLLYFSFPPRDAGRPLPTGTLSALPRVLKVPKGQPATPQSEPLVVGLEHRRQLQGLDEERIAFEIDMCIGCDRCMDACPLPLSAQIKIADLNQATISELVAPHVTRFTHECIMCGSCVPVCPVDNHRDLLMLSLKQRLGVSWHAQPDMKRVSAVLPAGWTVAMMLARLREQTLLRDPQVQDTYLLHIVAASRRRMLMPGEVLILEGEYGRDLYLILEGQLVLTSMDSEHAELPLAMRRRGEYVGDDGLLSGLPYKGSARAQTPVLLLQVPEQVMQRLLELAPSVRQHFERLSNAFSLRSILKRLALFQGVADADIEALVRQTSVKQYDRNERLFAEGKEGRPVRETLHILLEGFVKVARQNPVGAGQLSAQMVERVIAYRQGGDYFAGGLDLLGDGQAVTVTTINRCRIAEVPRQALLALFQRYPEVDHRFSARLREYLETTVATQGYALASGPLHHFASASRPADLIVQEGLHSLVSDGVVEGTEVLVIDLDKCIHCNECEEACERRHGHSRMNRKGMVVGNISIATACRQCQDPVCMLCSRAGIARHPNGEVYITESCIGCGICAERCPYGAISIVDIEDEPVAQSSWQRFSHFFAGKAANERVRKILPMLPASAASGSHVAPGPLDERSGYEALRKKIAIKCDLCTGYSDQACVQACPTGAALRIQPARFFGSTEEILRR